MYGFHKIPHLQQGVLKSDTDTEFWNFAHANFRRGQPDLLCLIQRKKQMATPGEEGMIDGSTVGLLPGPSGGGGANATASGNTSNPVLSNGQVLDINSIVNGIAVIKRHQTTISAELNELKRSNQLLWQDALAARAKHQKQQDTINRIVKFLAGVFGNHATAGSPVSPSSPVTPGTQHTKDDLQSSVAPLAKRKMRLMIEDAKRDGPRKSMVEELTDLPMEIDSSSLFETPSKCPFL
jgi:heat shock transcription factor